MRAMRVQVRSWSSTLLVPSTVWPWRKYLVQTSATLSVKGPLSWLRFSLARILKTRFGMSLDGSTSLGVKPPMLYLKKSLCILH